MFFILCFSSQCCTQILARIFLTNRRWDWNLLEGNDVRDWLKILTCCHGSSFLTDLAQLLMNHIGGVMVSVLASSAVDRGFKPWLGQIKDYKIGIRCFSAKHAALRRKSKDWLAQNQNNVSKWSDMSTADFCFSELAL